MPKSVVVSSDFDWGNDARPNTPWRQTVIYEVHVKGFTAAPPGRARAAARHLRRRSATRRRSSTCKSLGITAVELLPIHEAVDEGFLADKGLTNYWGYSTLGYFAPEQRYSGSGDRGGQVAEFKQMVKALHAAGLEVILDVVYNHTGEGNHLGPTLSFRGLDNPAYYWLKPDEPRYYLDYTGTGNSLNVNHPQTLQLIIDSLRYWVEEMHVDGFRFDLATVLGRTPKGYDRNAAFFEIVHQDPVLSRVKLIAEPWDVGMGGYQVGNFPVRWSEWNGKYRDAMRRYWKGDDSQAAELGYRLTGSSDLYLLSGRRPSASVNFVTAHDGFTLHDLVTYNEKHNEANVENNRDGANDNHSWNCGVEGETDDEKVNALREQQKRNFLATLFVSQGVPMLVAGDEIGRTQQGNNNAYCQDNEISWVDWNLSEKQKHLLDFTRQMIKLRKAQPVLQRRRFFRGAHIWDSELKDLAWFRPDGKEMTREDWEKPFVRSIGFLLGGDAIPTIGDQGQRVIGDTPARADERAPRGARVHAPGDRVGRRLGDRDRHRRAQGPVGEEARRRAGGGRGAVDDRAPEGGNRVVSARARDPLALARLQPLRRRDAHDRSRRRAEARGRGHPERGDRLDADLDRLLARVRRRTSGTTAATSRRSPTSPATSSSTRSRSTTCSSSSSSSRTSGSRPSCATGCSSGGSSARCCCAPGLILVGTALVTRFHWVLYLFGAFLLFTAWKMATSDEEEVDPSQNAVLRFARKILPVSKLDQGGKFFTREHGRFVVTPLFLVLIVVETTDLIFALDSIPAVMGITQDPFIVYTSNVAAILGLRSLFFVVASLMDKFHYLKVGLSVVLAFVGVKMLISGFYEIHELVSLGVIFAVLAVSIGVSMARPRVDEPPAGPSGG